MSFEGMDVAAVRGLGARLGTQADTLGHLVAAVDGLVGEAVHAWDGPDANDFRRWWETQHRPRLVQAQESLAGLGRSAEHNAFEQESVSGQGHAGAGAAVTVGATAAGAAAAAAAGTATAAPSHAAAGVSGRPGPAGRQDFQASRSVALAKAEIGTTRKTGWNQEGECVKSVQRWINSAGGHFGGGGVVSGYQNSGAVEVPMRDVAPGDVLQFTSTTNPDSWSAGPVHTVLVAQVNHDGSYDIVQSNAHYDGTVSEVSHWTPRQHDDMTWRAWRFAARP